MNDEAKLKTRISRRDFLRRTAVLSAGAAAFPMIAPSSALGRDGHTAPSERMVIGCVGIGNMGTGNMRRMLSMKEIQVVAVCDVDGERRDKGKEIVDERYDTKDCAAYNDFRELFSRRDLDGVMIAVPDHWHALLGIAAANRGLHIYAEKPLALTIREGQAMVEAVERNDVTWQTGSWQRSVKRFRYACELVRNGRIGRVHTVKVGLPTGKPIEPQQEMPIPESFDYDFWLGPAPWAPYTKERCHWSFRWSYDYSGGQLTDWGAHHCDIANWAMATERTGPVEVEGTGVFPRDGLWDAATDYHITARYAPGESPVSPQGFTMLISNEYEMGARFEGEDGWLHISRGGLKTSPEGLKKSEIGPDEIHLYESKNHMKNFLECALNGDPTITPIEVAHRAISIAHLGNIAMRTGRTIRWDPVHEQIVNDPVASRLLGRSMRAPWRLG